MSYLYSQALVAAYLADTCSDGAPFAPSSGSPTPQAYCAPDKMTAFSRPSRFGMTFAPLTEDRGAALLTWYQAAFPARTSAPPAKVLASTASDPAFGGKWRELSVKYDRDSHLWKTHHCLWEEDLPESSLTLPKWGSMRAGVLSERMTSALPTAEIAAGLWPTPTTSTGGSNNNSRAVLERGHGTNLVGAVLRKWPTPKANDAEKRGNFDVTNPRNGLPAAVKTWRTPSASVVEPKNTVVKLTGRKPTDPQVGLADQVGGQLNPAWVEKLMGWIPNWTSLEPIDDHRVLLDMPWPAEWEDGIPRIAQGVVARVDRLKAIGNGQVPQCAAAAWRILVED